MAQFNLIQRPDLNDRLVRALGIRERAPAPTLSPEVVAAIILEDLTISSPFERSLTRECGGIALVAAVAGQLAQMQLKNPAASGMVAIVRRLTVHSPTASGIVYWGHRITAADEVATASRYFKDQRYGGFPTCDLRYGTNAALRTNAIGSMAVGGTVNSVIGDANAIVLPGQSFSASISSANIGATFALEWAEYTS